MDVGSLRLAGSYPVRVEVAPRAPLAQVADLMGEIEALVRPLRKELPPCEIIQLQVETESDVEACIAVAQGLRARGLTVPLAVNAPSALPGLTRLLPHVAKLNVSPTPHADATVWTEQLGELIEAVKACGCALQWDVSPACLPSPLTGEGGGGIHVPYASHPDLPPQGGKGHDAQPSGTGLGEGRILEGLIDTALGIARLCQAHGLDDYLMAMDGVPTIPAYRLLAARLATAGLETPLTLKTARYAPEDTLLRAALTLGSLLCDGFGDVIGVVSDLPSSDALRLSYNILQGARRRISKTEFISCPSCGRTQFDLETTTQRIKSQTGHLTGVKIAIMGCIVNGPGEMADADFGYVGAGPGKINLYVGRECVERNIAFELADRKLIELIKTQGKWIDPA
jgi:1-hydroxy-2-methyl-2-(E)-butenyl 4-diphosphate synthase